jgi:outer membrane protein assembly factor BamB
VNVPVASGKIDKEPAMGNADAGGLRRRRVSSVWFLTVFAWPLALCVTGANAADWPRFGGPAANWISPETNLARTWPAEGPPVLWSIDVGEGFAGAAVAKGEVYLLDRKGNQQDVLRCLALDTGKELWRLAFDAPGSLPFNGSRSVPTIERNRVFAVSPFGQLYCVDRTGHQLRWTHHLVDEFKDPKIDREEAPRNRDETLARAQLPTWGLTQAPLIYRDTVIVAPQTQETGVVAYDQDTGKLRWRSGYIGRNWYSHVSPLLATLCGVDQVIMLAQPSDPEKSPDDAPPAIISSVDARTGEILWTNLTPAPYKIPISEPVSIGNDRIFITGGYGLGCLALQISRSGTAWKTSIAFHTRVAASHIQSPVFYRERIYLTSFKEHRGEKTGLVCLRPNGELVWQTGPETQFDSGPFLIANGMVFILHGKTGVLNLFELNDSGPTLLTKTKVLEAKEGKAWAPMALSDGKLILRDQRQMKCLDVRITKAK